MAIFTKKFKSLIILIIAGLAVYGIVKFLIWDSKNSGSRKEKIAIAGYDIVAFYKENRAVEGVKSISHNWNNCTWYFKDDNYRLLFVADPDLYAPQYGGNCAFTTSIGKAQRGLPKYWEMRNDKLYLNSNLVSHFLWKHLPDRVAKADKHWIRLTAN